MAGILIAVLIYVAALALGVALGRWIFRPRRVSPSQLEVMPRPLSAEYERHCEGHALAMTGSVALTAPGARIDFDWNRPSGQKIVPLITDFIQPKDRT